VLPVDIEVENTFDSYRLGSDNVLEAVLAYEGH